MHLNTGVDQEWEEEQQALGMLSSSSEDSEDLQDTDEEEEHDAAEEAEEENEGAGGAEGAGDVNEDAKLVVDGQDSAAPEGAAAAEQTQGDASIYALAREGDIKG